MIEAKNISFSYGGRQALSEICAKFGDGEFTAILGANGAGKSTLLKLLSGWLAPCFGEITYGGQNIKILARASLPQSARCSNRNARSILNILSGK